MLVELAGDPSGKRVTVRALATAIGVPQSFARRIVTDLAGAGLVDARRGAGGGAVLARPAEEITLHDVLLVMEGGIALNRCVRYPGSCAFAPACPAHPVWQGAGRALAEYLDACTVADLAARKSAAPE